MNSSSHRQGQIPGWGSVAGERPGGKLPRGSGSVSGRTGGMQRGGCRSRSWRRLTSLLVVGVLVASGCGGGSGEVSEPTSTAFQVGQCVHLHDDGMEVVPCITDSSVIVARGVAGTSCPMGAIAVVLPTRTEQVCVAPSVG